MPISRDSTSTEGDGSTVEHPADARTGATASLDAQQLRALADATWKLVCRADAHCRFTRPQEAWEKFTGQAWPEYQSSGWLQAIHTQQRGAIEAARREALRHHTPCRCRARLWQRATDSYRGVILQFVPQTDSQTGLPEWIVAVCDDELPSCEPSSGGSRPQVNDTRRAKSSFLANVSHELRTPMYGIIGMTELALEEEPSPTVREYLQVAKSSAEVLVRLVNEILDFSKLESGKFVLEAAPLSLERLLDETIKPFCPVAGEKGLDLTCSIAADVPDALIGDALRLRQVLTNLLHNALKFSQEGEVALRVTLESQSVSEAALCFEVSDTGIGIVESDRDRIFAPFTQVDASSTRRHGGTGLGLTIAYELVRRMGGTIQLNSKPREGSTFVVRLTLRKHKSSQIPTRGQLVRNANFAGRRVLVVDETPTHRACVEQLLSDWQLETVPAISDETPWNQIVRAATGQPRCEALVIDSRLRDDEGVSLVDRCLAMDWGLPILVLLPVGERRPAHFSPPIAAYLEKPVSHAAIWNALCTAWCPPPEGVVPAHHAAKTFPPARRVRVLLAEDTVANQTIVKRILGKRGHTVEIARNGREVVEMVRQQPFDIMLMDVQMPVMDGIQATGAIRSFERHLGIDRRVPIMALTAHAMQDDRERCLAAGMDAYLSKPVDSTVLVNLVETLAATAQHPAPANPGDAIVEGPCFDLASALSRLGDDPSFFATLVEFFLEDSPDLLARIRASLASGDANSLEHAAHSLKGLVANFDAHQAVQASARLEKAGRQGNFEEAAAGLEPLDREIARLREALWPHRPAAKQ